MAWSLGVSIIFIVVALLFGVVAGWLLWGRRSSARAARSPKTAVKPFPAEPVTAKAPEREAPAAVTEAEPAVEIEPAVEAEPAAAEPIAEPVAAEPIAEPIAESEPVAVLAEPVAEPVAVVAEPIVEPEPSAAVAEPELVAEPVAAEPEPVVEAEPVVAEPEPVAEPVAVEPEPVAVEPEPVAEAEPVAAVAEPEPVVEPVAAPVVLAEPATESADELTRIEGIGPKIAAALVGAGIRTYGQLADTDAATLRATLKAAGVRAAASLPTWPEQARLLATRAQNGHAKLADELITADEPAAEATPPVEAAEPETEPEAPAAPEPVAEVEPEVEPEVVAEPETPAAEAEAPVADVEAPVAEVEAPVAEVPAQREPEPEAAVAAGPDNLTVIEGIGPKMASALVSAGITTYEQLATTDLPTIRAALAAAGVRSSSSLPTWPRQARALADGSKVRG